MKKNHKRIIKGLFPIVSLVIVFAFLMSNDKLDQLVKAIHQIKPTFILMAMGCMVSYWLLESIILHKLIHHTDSSLSFKESVRITLAGQFFNNVTPFASGGQPMQLYMLHKNEVSVGEGASVLTKKFIVYQAVLVVYTLMVIVFGAKFFLSHIPNFTYLGLIGFALNVIVIMALVLIGWNYKLTKGMMIRLSRFVRRRFKNKKMNRFCTKTLKQMTVFHEQMRKSKETFRTWMSIVFYTLIQHTFYFSIPLVIGYGFQLPHLSILYMIGAAAFVSMVTAFIPLPGAALGAEGSFYLVYQMFFPSNIVVAALLIWRLCTYYLPLFVGGTVVMAGSRYDQKPLLENQS